MLPLTEGLHCRIIAGTPIFLDVTNGRYFLLRGTMAARYLGLVQGSASSGDVQALIDAHLLNAQDSGGKVPACAPEAVSSAYDTMPTHVPVGLVMEAIVRQRLAIFTLRRQAISALLAEVTRAKRQKRRRETRRSPQSETMIATAFHRAQRYTRATDRCLPRSLALAAMLRAHGHDPVVIFGVRLPFAAHCWVQCDDRLLSDPLERARGFVPILAV